MCFILSLAGNYVRVDRIFQNWRKSNHSISHIGMILLHHCCTIAKDVTNNKNSKQINCDNFWWLMSLINISEVRKMTDLFHGVKAFLDIRSMKVSFPISRLTGAMNKLLSLYFKRLPQVEIIWLHFWIWISLKPFGATLNYYWKWTPEVYVHLVHLKLTSGPHLESMFKKGSDVQIGKKKQKIKKNIPFRDSYELI